MGKWKDMEARGWGDMRVVRVLNVVVVVMVIMVAFKKGGDPLVSGHATLTGVKIKP